jgi:hypothetical protein
MTSRIDFRSTVAFCFESGFLIPLYLKSKSSFSAFSKVERSFEESLPKSFITSFRSIVEMADLTADGFNKPAPC